MREWTAQPLVFLSTVPEVTFLPRKNTSSKKYVHCAIKFIDSKYANNEFSNSFEESLYNHFHSKNVAKEKNTGKGERGGVGQSSFHLYLCRGLEK